MKDNRIAPAAFALASLCSTMPATGQPSAAVETSNLAGQIVDLVSPRSEVPARAEAFADGMPRLLSLTAALSGGMPDFDEDQLRMSFRAGSSAALAETRASLIAALTGNVSEGDLRAALAFYRSPAGRSALHSRAAYENRLRAAIRNSSTGGGNAHQALPTYTPNRAETAFAQSTAGRSLASASATQGPSSDPMQRAIELAEVDYCHHAACELIQHDFFRRMDASISPGRAHGEHAMWGYTAAGLFSNANVAALARAACTGDADGVRNAVRGGVDPNSFGAEGSGPGGVSETVTPLLWAIDCGNLEGIEALLTAGADPNQREQFGATSVTVAADNRDPRILSMLLAHGGDPNAHTDRETAPEIALVAADGFDSVDHLPQAASGRIGMLCSLLERTLIERRRMACLLWKRPLPTIIGTRWSG